MELYFEMKVIANFVFIAIAVITISAYLRKALVMWARMKMFRARRRRERRKKEKEREKCDQ